MNLADESFLSQLADFCPLVLPFKGCATRVLLWATSNPIVLAVLLFMGKEKG